MKIGLFDHMGYGNLGDAATQEALIANIKSRLPDADIIGFSLNPDDTRKRHNIPSYSITNWHPGLDSPEAKNTNASDSPPRLKSILKKIPVLSPIALWIRELVRESIHLGRSFKVLRSLDCLIIAGGGQLGELWRGPWAHPYNVFKFCALTKLANRKLLFLNVGAGPLDSSLGKAFVRYSVNLADYVSFRDVESQALVRRLGVKRATFVFPDSVYALDVSEYESVNSLRPSRLLVGLNPIGFCDPRSWCKSDLSAYSRYLDKLVEFVDWLVSHNYGIRLFAGEKSVDMWALQDLKERLLHRFSPAQIDEICLPPSGTVNDLLNEMSQFDFVVTSKFHGVVFSHMLEKPVIALSYHKKIDDRMKSMGHSQYCLNIESFDQESLTKAFIALVGDAEKLKSEFRQASGSYANELKAQFDELFVPENLQTHSLESSAKRDGAVISGSV
jgi:polysaccharide pyruvyl transferase WcaK-like protein